MWLRKIALVFACLILSLIPMINIESVIKTLANNDINIEIYGSHSSLNLEASSATNNVIFEAPERKKDGFVVKGDFESKNSQNISITLKPLKKDENITIHLMGPDVKSNGSRVPVLVDYKNFVMNGKKMFSHKITWHDKTKKIETHVKKGQSLEFNVTAQKPSIISLRKCFHFSSHMFIIMFCFWMFVLSVLVKFVGNKESKPDALLVAIFGIILFIPMLHISDADKSEQENRVLATKPSLMVNNKVNEKYGAEFNNWFNDRFFGRNILVNLDTGLRYNLSPRVVRRGKCANKQTKWLGRCPHVYKMFSDEQLDLMAKNLEKLKSFTDKNNIKLYILIAPTQGSVYGKNIFPNYTNKNEIERVHQAMDYIKEHTNIDVVFPYNEIADAAKDDYVFFRTDSHWTDVGAFIAYQQVINNIKKDFKDIKVLTKDDFNYVYKNKVKVSSIGGFHNGRDYTVMGLKDNSFFNSNYKYFVHKKSEQVKISYDNHRKKENYYVTRLHFDDGKYNLMMFGDSFGENLEPIMPYSFKNTFKIYTYVPSDDLLAKNLNFERFEKQALENKTNVLLITFSEIDRLMYLY